MMSSKAVRVVLLSLLFLSIFNLAFSSSVGDNCYSAYGITYKCKIATVYNPSIYEVNQLPSDVIKVSPDKFSRLATNGAIYAYHVVGDTAKSLLTNKNGVWFLLETKEYFCCFTLERKMSSVTIYAYVNPAIYLFMVFSSVFLALMTTMVGEVRLTRDKKP